MPKLARNRASLKFQFDEEDTDKIQAILEKCCQELEAVKSLYWRRPPDLVTACFETEKFAVPEPEIKPQVPEGKVTRIEVPAAEMNLKVN